MKIYNHLMSGNSNQSDRAGLWIGEFEDGEIVVYAPQLQDSSDTEYVHLWGFQSNKVDRYVESICRPHNRPLKDSQMRGRVLVKFEAVLEAQLRRTTERHRERLESAGLPYAGVVHAGKRSRRVTHCWSCHKPLDNSVDVECGACGWILCGCGACGCGR